MFKIDLKKGATGANFWHGLVNKYKDDVNPKTGATDATVSMSLYTASIFAFDLKKGGN